MKQLPSNALTKRNRQVVFMLDDFLREPEPPEVEKWQARHQIDDNVVAVCALLRVFLPDDAKAQEVVDYLIGFADDFEDVAMPQLHDGRRYRDFADFEMEEAVRMWRHKMRHIRFRGEYADISDTGTGPLGTDAGWSKYDK